MDFGRLWNATLPPDRLAVTELRRSLSDSNVIRSVPGNRVSGCVFVEQRSPFFMQEFRGILAAVSEEKSLPCRRILYRNPEIRSLFSARERGFFGNLSSSPFPCPSGRSAPRNVPVLPKRKVTREKEFACGGEAGEEEDGDEDESFMPHELAGKSPTTKFSVVEGAGRTLKGRDLRRVRNSVWRKTGFLG